MRESVLAVSRRAVRTLKAMLIPGLALLLALVPAAVVNLAMPALVSAAIAQRGNATTGTTVNTDLTIDKPTGVVAGDVMIVNIAKAGNKVAAPASPGWTVVSGADLGGAPPRHGAVLYRVADGTEGASFTFALGLGTTGAVGSIVAFSGVDTSGSTPFDVAPGAISVSPVALTAVSATSISTVSADAAVIMFGMAANSAPTWSGWTTASPGALTELYGSQISGSSKASVGAAWATKATAGNTGAGAATLSSAERNGGILIALKPATPTELDVAAAIGTYGGTVDLTATLSPAAADKTIDFTLNGSAVGSASTDSTGVAYISAASLSGIACGTYPAGVGASFAGDAGFSGSNGTASLTVKGRDLTVTATGVDKVYDGTIQATVNLSTDALGGDTVSAGYTSAVFSDKNVGNGKAVSVSGISISGADAGNYNLLNTTASTTADITARDLTVTATGVDKVYDGTIQATVNLNTDALGGDTLTAGYTSAVFGDKNVGNGKAVSVSGISISGADAGNYNLLNTTASTTADITARDLTVTANNSSKVYGDADPVLTHHVSSGLLAPGDAFSGELARVVGEAVGTYAIQQGTLALNDNYNLTFVEGTFTIRSSDAEAPSAPTVDSISPQSGHPGDTLYVTIHGNNFTEATAVDFGPGVTVNNFEVESPTRIVANITIDPAAELGDNNIVITTPSGNSTSSAAFSIDLSAVTTRASGAGGLWLLLILVLLAIVGGFLLFAWLKRRKKRVAPELAPILAPSRPVGGTREAAEPARAPAAYPEQPLGEAAQAMHLEQAPAMTAEQPLEGTEKAADLDEALVVAAVAAAGQPLEEAGKTADVEQAPTMTADQLPGATEEAVEPEQAPATAAATAYQPLEGSEKTADLEQPPMAAAGQPLEETEKMADVPQAAAVATSSQPPEDTEKPADVPQAAAAVASQPRRRTTKRKTTTSAASAPRKPTKRRKKATG